MMTERPATPDDEKPEASASASVPEPAPELTPAEPPAGAAEIKPEAEPPTEGDAPVGEAASEASVEESQPLFKRLRWKAISLDAGLILLLVAVLACAVYIFRNTAERYHVPTPMEQLLSESEELERRYNELLPRANHADTQLHLRARLAQLEGQAMRLSALIAEKKGAIDDQHGRVLAMQYNIRQADETNRSIARSLLPGMPVGNVTTTTGKAYRNATIYRLDKRYIYLRFPEGQARFPLRHLVKDNLPELARYAFGELDLVDMSDFEQTGESTAPAPVQVAPVSRRPAAPQSESYDPAPGAPVLDAEANRTTTTRVPEGESSEEDVWEAPSGDLPM